MKKTLLGSAVVAAIIAFAGAYGAFADSVYHTERLAFSLTDEGEGAGHSELRSGQVVNIHPNGPQVGAIEQYVLNGASPNTEYQIYLHAFDTGCQGGEFGGDFPIPTAVVSTGPSGNGKASFVFSPDALAGFSGMTVGAQWTAEFAGLVVYETVCTTVTID